METDLEKIKKLASEKEDENYKFRRYLKGCDSDRIDDIVHSLYDKISSEIDCSQCRNCCKVSNPVFKEYELDRAAEHLNLTIEELKEKYDIEKVEIYNMIRKDICSFLEDNKCILENNKPEPCKNFPHIQKEGFVFRLLDVIQNTEICPIVYNVYEELKKREW